MILYSTKYFQKWFSNLKDISAIKIIERRLVKLQVDNYAGEIKYLRDNISELKINFGPGYRIYIGKYKQLLIILVSGGDKSTQNKDIDKAINILKKYINDNLQFLEEVIKNEKSK
ncbi:MAG: type II toxin-antitoxin system RelE/ParE family toxin [Elusimicrobiota bacterium]|nr:type II toxin-antitoxin system RelE/ParE family toxin [Elusimicrobiota bacterium]